MFMLRGIPVGMPIDRAFGMPNNERMKTSEVVTFYGSKAALAAALGLRPPSISEWGEFPPPLRQLQIEALSGGELKAEPSCYPQAKPMPALEQQP
jgi:hypothetical protein